MIKIRKERKFLIILASIRLNSRWMLMFRKTETIKILLINTLSLGCQIIAMSLTSVLCPSRQC